MAANFARFTSRWRTSPLKLRALLNRKLFRGCRPIVIGGCARSGTTLLLSILSSHPRIFAIPHETQALCPTAYYGEFDREAPLETKAIDSYLSSAQISRHCRYWCEKTPKNIHFFGRILSHFGKSVKLLQIVRDGRDVVCSIHPDDLAQYWVKPDRWVEDVATGLNFAGHSQVLTIRFEDLVTSFDETLQEICHFLGLELTEHLTRYPEFATVSSSNAWQGSAQRPNDNSIGRWRTGGLPDPVRELLADPAAVRLLQHYRYLEQDSVR